MAAAIIISKKDPAGMNIKKQLIELQGFAPAGRIFDSHEIYQKGGHLLYTLSGDTIFAEHLDQQLSAEVLIFATKHQSQSGIPSLCLHAPGNWGRAEHGGPERNICIAPASLLKKGLQLLDKKNKQYHLHFEVFQEATHHGPTLDLPCMFIEIGSSEKEWGMELPGRIIAETIVELIKNPIPPAISAVAIGGLHHLPNFNKITLLDPSIGISHGIAKYSLEDIDEEIIRQAMERSEPPASFFILDWKGLKGEKERILNILGLFSLPVRRTKEWAGGNEDK